MGDTWDRATLEQHFVGSSRRQHGDHFQIDILLPNSEAPIYRFWRSNHYNNNNNFLCILTHHHFLTGSARGRAIQVGGGGESLPSVFWTSQILYPFTPCIACIIPQNRRRDFMDQVMITHLHHPLISLSQDQSPWQPGTFSKIFNFAFSYFIIHLPSSSFSSPPQIYYNKIQLLLVEGYLQ